MSDFGALEADMADLKSELVEIVQLVRGKQAALSRNLDEHKHCWRSCSEKSCY